MTRICIMMHLCVCVCVTLAIASADSCLGFGRFGRYGPEVLCSLRDPIGALEGGG